MSLESEQSDRTYRSSDYVPTHPVENEQWLQERLSPDEEVKWAERPHPITLLYPTLSFVFVTAVAVVLTLLPTIPFAGLEVDLGFYPLLSIPFVGLLLLYSIKERRNHYYVLTDEKFIERHGVLKRRRDPIRYTRMQDVETRETTSERLMEIILGWDIGTIKISTAGENKAKVVKNAVPNVGKAGSILDEQKSKWDHKSQGNRNV